jgi:GntR family phosphonate transport system transcriptional regulator
MGLMGQPRVTSASSAQGVTLWRRIADDFEQAILTGAYATGDRLPGEVEIAGRLGVNRHTVRRALAELTERGLVRAERGSGTYVEPARLAYPIGARTRFSEIVGTAGREVGGRLIAHATEPASRVVAERLGLDEGDVVVRLDILRSADRIPLCSATSWVSAKRMPEAARIYRTNRSMTRTLAHFGIRDYRRQSTYISAATADAVDAERLRLAPGRALLVVDSVDVTPSGRAILTTRARFAADRVELVVNG